MFDFLKMVRAFNLFMVALTQYLTALFLVGTPSSRMAVMIDPGFFLLVLSTVIITAAGYLINDYYDIKIDYVNRPDRVRISRTLNRRWLIASHIALNFPGIALGFYLSPEVGIIHSLAAFFLWLYSNRLKRQPFVGNFVVAALTGTTLFLVGEYFGERKYLILSYALFAGFITLIREIIKDMEDMKGDERFGCKTLPIIWGIAGTKKFIYGIIALFSITAWLMIGTVSTELFVGLILTLILLIFGLVKANTVREYRRLSSFCKILMLLGVLSMIMLNVEC